MSKGSWQRRANVPMSQVDSNWDSIFNKGNDMQVRAETLKTGTCGCGRSPTGNCIGWHGLSEGSYKAALEKYNQDTSAKPLG